MNIEKSNKLIAEFMGIKTYRGGKGIGKGQIFYRGANPNHFKSVSQNTLHYHSSWDWLMPVVEKIEGLGWEVQIGYHLYAKESEILVHDSGDSHHWTYRNSSKIQAVYEAVIEFIKFYNEQK